MTIEQAHIVSPEMAATEDRLQEIARLFRRVRWLAVALIVPRFMLLAPDGKRSTPWDPFWTGLVLVVLLVVTNAHSGWIGKRGLPSLRIGMWSGVLSDSVVVCGVTLVAFYEGRQPGVVMLLIPIYEAAACFGFRVALVTSLATSGTFFVGTQVLADGSTSDGDLSLFAYQLGALYLVVLVVGTVAELTSRELLGAKRQAVDADRRSDLLRIAATASRAAGTARPGHALEALLNGASRLGYDSVVLFIEVDEPGVDAPGSLDPTLAIGKAVLSEQGMRTLKDLVAHQVQLRGQAVVVDWSDPGARGSPEVSDLDLGLALGVPVRKGGEVKGVLVAATVESRAIHPAEIECLDLLAAHAGAIFDASRYLDETRGLEDRLAFEVSHDRLTGLPNRAWFIDNVDEALRYGITSVLVCDLDRFKTINDSLGHDFGDAILDTTAARLLEIVGSRGLVARLGADQFAIHLPLATGEDAMDVAHEVLEGFSEPLRVGQDEMSLSLSIGVACSEGMEASGGVQLVRDANLAMYRAKRAGRSRCQLFDLDLRAIAHRRMDTETELRRVIANEGIGVAYQPVVSLSTGAVVSIEALARWQHPLKGVIHPDEFIPLAEETGLIFDLGRDVLTKACIAARSWQMHFGERAPRVGVNLSAMQLEDPTCVDMLVEVLGETGLDASSLVLEITESAVMGDSPQLHAAIEGIAALGIRLAVDDFGKGWSSLSYLARFPLHELKIDRTFVEGMTTTPADRSIVASVIQLAHELGLVVVAEGIEYRSQLDELTALGCDEGQGYHLFRPQSPEAISLVLERVAR